MDITTQLVKNTELGDGIGNSVNRALTLAEIQANYRIPWQELDAAITGAGYARSSVDLSQLSKALGKVTALTSGSPYTSAFGDVLEINATTNPYVVNMPASTGSGRKVRYINTSTASTGLIKIVPNGTDDVGAGAGVAVYLQNLDQSGYLTRRKWVEFQDVSTGFWSCIGGQFIPEPGSIDSAGTQYFLGKLIHLPLANTTSRQVFSGALTNLAFTAAINVTGTVGVPVGAKAIRVKVNLSISSTGAGAIQAFIHFSDNNSSTPPGGANSAHGGAAINGQASGAAQIFGYTTEVDVPMNASGRFFIYTNNVINGTATAVVSVVGYYMGD